MILSNPETTITLADGEEYKLKSLNMNMMEEVEEKFDSTWSELMSQPRMKVLKYSLWLRMKDSHPKLKLNELGELVTVDILIKAYEGIAK